MDLTTFGDIFFSWGEGGEKTRNKTNKKIGDSTLYFRREDDTKFPDRSSKQLFKDKQNA
jgi:3'-phosphoadenosine 5'-phosphosulfate sulfotransferase